jgi:hypothetical protein
MEIIRSEQASNNWRQGSMIERKAFSPHLSVKAIMVVQLGTLISNALAATLLKTGIPFVN